MCLRFYRKLVCISFIVMGLTQMVFAQTNQVLVLNGNSGYVAVSSSSYLQPSNAITVEAWVFPVLGSHPNSFFINKSDGQNALSQRTYELYCQTPGPNGAGDGIGFIVFLGSSTYAYGFVPVSTNQWTHFAAVYTSNPGLLNLYTNGVLASSTSHDAGGVTPLAGLTVRQTTQPLYFGVNLIDFQLGEVNTFAAGYLDEIRIWGTSRTGIQIAESRFCRLTGSESSLMAYWNFDGTNAIDLTGHGNSGTFQGGAAAVPVTDPDPVHAGVCGAPYFDPASLSFHQLLDSIKNYTPQAA